MATLTPMRFRALLYHSLAASVVFADTFIDDVSDSTFSVETFLLQMQFSLQVGEIQNGLFDNHRTNASSQHANTTANQGSKFVAKRLVSMRHWEEFQLVGFHEHATLSHSYAQLSARVLLIVFAAYVLVRETRPLRASEAPPKVEDTLRNAHFDNAKFLALSLVVLGHWFSTGNLPFTECILKATWFHFFCMLSGAVSTAPPTRYRLVRFAVSNVGPLIMACLVLFPLGGVIISIANGAEVGQTLSNVDWRKASPFELIVSYGFGPIWYLRIIVIWRLSSWMMYAIPGHLQLALSLFVGTMVVVQNDDGVVFGPNADFIVVRAATMAPFFFAGRCIDWQWLASVVPEPSHRLLAASWIVLFGYVALYEAFPDSCDTFLMAVETWWHPFVRCCHQYDLQTEQFQQHCWARYWADLLLRGAQAVLFFLFCVPRGRVYFTTRGTRSMYPYLLHMMVLRLGFLHAPKAGASWTALNPYGTWGTVGISAIMQLASFLGCVVLTFLLASDACRDVFGWALEPTWLFDIGTRGARLVDWSSDTKP
eukprot:CAMPEP_0117604934 /NCGR_PEP_ID=MMETSP0784-20121206/78938_1 /TAXON_ID=39447 /ORGANISM="" /LENGTH=537 /DNA_ID=CAMNT_0005407971 /DNA_START=90 /DNA_END=1703 /DNA_ORIENTATION=+